MSANAIVVLCTCSDEASAERIAMTLVEERLTACVNRILGIASIYSWQGKIARDSECLLLTTRERFDARRDRLVACLHMNGRK